VLVWQFERDGAYSVKSAYKDILNHDVAVIQHRVPGNWNCIWSLKLPSKVKNFLWRACRNCLPTRIRLQSKGVQCTDRCAVCDDFGEDSTHLFFMCNKSMICWQRSGLWSILMAVFDIDASFPTNVFAILHHLDQQQKQVFSVTLWSIWKHRNNKVWNNVTETAQAICARAGSLLTIWRNAQTIRHPIPQHPATPNDLKWIKPSPGRFKCNVDAAFSQARNRVGIGVCIRDDEGRCVSQD
jgi:hypothetical protein